MAKLTNTVLLSTDDWTEIASAKDTVLIECQSNNGCEIAIAGALADLGAEDDGHILALTGNGMAMPLFNVGTNKVFARRLNSTATTLVVSAY